MKRFSLALLLAALVLTAGCVIAPIPLIESRCDYLWTGPGPDGRVMTIEAVERTWYMPILASPEGPAKHRSLESQYTYYAEEGESNYREDHVPNPRAIRLPWFDQKVEGNFNWGHCVRIEGTPYWCMQRVVNWDDEKNSSPKVGPRVLQIEYAVFDLQALKSKTTLPVIYNKYGIMDRYDTKTRAIEHETPSGWRRYRLLDGIDEEISRPDWVVERYGHGDR